MPAVDAGMSGPAQIDPLILDEAAEWLMRLGEGNLSNEELRQWQQWRTSNLECERAWRRAERLLGSLGGLPADLALSSLDRPVSPQRRAMLARLAALLALAPASWLGWQLNEHQGWSADFHSPIGQRRQLTLLDGSRVTLNTDTSIDVAFDGQQRLVRLLRGEILLRGAADIQVPARPLRVSTAQGRLQALGTVFSVREDAGMTRLAVLEGRVQIELSGRAQATPRVVMAGQQCAFSASAIGALGTTDSSRIAWTEGMLVADRMPMGEFAAELARYRPGIVRCDPAVAGVRVSGAFPLDDSQRALNMLGQTYPVQVTSRLGGYWVTIAPV